MIKFYDIHEDSVRDLNLHWSDGFVLYNEEVFIAGEAEDRDEIYLMDHGTVGTDALKGICIPDGFWNTRRGPCKLTRVFDRRFSKGTAARNTQCHLLSEGVLEQIPLTCAQVRSIIKPYSPQYLESRRLEGKAVALSPSFALSEDTKGKAVLHHPVVGPVGVYKQYTKRIYLHESTQVFLEELQDLGFEVEVHRTEADKKECEIQDAIRKFREAIKEPIEGLDAGGIEDRVQEVRARWQRREIFEPIQLANAVPEPPGLGVAEELAIEDDFEEED